MPDHESVTIYGQDGRPWHIRRQKTVSIKLPDGRIVRMYKAYAECMVAEGKAQWPEASK